MCPSPFSLPPCLTLHIDYFCPFVHLYTRPFLCAKLKYHSMGSRLFHNSLPAFVQFEICLVNVQYNRNLVETQKNKLRTWNQEIVFVSQVFCMCISNSNKTSNFIGTGQTCYTADPHYNKVIGTMIITLLCKVKTWDPQNIRPLYNEFRLY